MLFRLLNLAATALVLCMLYSCGQVESPVESTVTMLPSMQAEYAIAIHGGAGVIKRENLDTVTEARIRGLLSTALSKGRQALIDGASASDVVVEVISFLEDQGDFNAGKGAVFTYDGINELDASIMRGEDLEAGAISGVQGVKNPIKLARAVLEKSDHVMLSGAGALEFAKEQAIEIVPMDYFFTQRRYDSWKRARAKADAKPELSENGKFGTVGCVVLDKAGNLAAGTSTGGMTLKRYNRIGDSPVIGAGTYADNRSCAVSATGHGEYFIRYAVAHDISARMQHGAKSLAMAADEVVMQELKRAGGEGGIIAVDHYGNVAMPFNSAGMYRGFATPDTMQVAIFGDEL